MPDETLERLKGRREERRKKRSGLLHKAAVLKKRIAHTTARIVKRKATLAERNAGDRALAYAGKFLGKTEQPAGSNDAPFLALWRKDLPTLAWMKGQPWCGFMCIAAWFYGAGVRLPDGVVFTPNIVAWANRGEHFVRVRPEDAKPGDLVVFNFVGGSAIADHVGLARGPARGGVIPTREGNTMPGNSGSQANGGGQFDRTRPVGQIAVVARPKAVAR